MSELVALKKAVKIAGGQAPLARKCAEVSGRKCEQKNVWSWLNRSKRVPGDFAIPVETVTGVARHELRPDLYPVEQTQ